jgi:MFS family permease
VLRVNVLRDPAKRRWVGWLVLATAFLLVNVYRLSTAVLASDLAATFQTTAAALGSLHAAFFYIYAPLQILAGVLADRVGIRRTAAVGTVVMSTGGLAFAFAPTFGVAFAARTLIGFGASVIFIAALRYIANWFRPDEFATVSGLTVAVAGAGGIIATTPLALLVAETGWRNAVGLISASGVVIAVIVAVIVRDRPAAAGIEAVDGVPEGAATRSLREVLASVRRVLAEREMWLVSILLFCGLGLNLTVLGLWGIPFVVQVYGLSVPDASVYAFAGSVGLLIGPPTMGWLSDRLERRTHIMVVGAALYALGFATLALGQPPLFVVGVVFFTIAFLAGAFSLGYTVIKERHETAASGVATGSVNAIAFTGAAVFPSVMGAVLDAYWTGEEVAGARVYTPEGYRVAFSLALGAAVVALGCAVWLHLRTHYSEAGTPATVAGD